MLPIRRYSSLNLLVLVFVSGAVSLSQVDIAFNVLDLSVVDIYWCVGFRHHLCLRLVHLQTLIVIFSSVNSCSICCSSCGVLAHMSMSSATNVMMENSTPTLCQQHSDIKNVERYLPGIYIEH